MRKPTSISAHRRHRAAGHPPVQPVRKAFKGARDSALLQQLRNRATAPAWATGADALGSVADASAQASAE
jgi:hypothetical protein